MFRAYGNCAMNSNGELRSSPSSAVNSTTWTSRNGPIANSATNLHSILSSSSSSNTGSNAIAGNYILKDDNLKGIYFTKVEVLA